MKNITFILLLLMCFIELKGQEDFDFKSPINALHNGVFERTIVTAQTDKRQYFIGNAVISPRNEVFKMFFRFDSTKVYDSTSLENILKTKPAVYDFVIGKVFMSEMYSEINYRKKYKNTKDFKADNDGFFYYYKLFYDKLNNEYRINIYPNLPHNFCKKKMHWNLFTCLSEKQHENTLINIIALKDYNYIDFLPQESMIDLSKDLTNRLKSNNKISRKLRSHVFDIKKDLDTQWTDFKSKVDTLTNITIVKRYWTTLKNVPNRDNLIASLNIHKDIKSFKFIDLNKLQLVFTKYSYSEDLIEKNRYDYVSQSYKNYQDFFDKDTTKISIANSWLKELTFSKKADDKVIKGMVDMEINFKKPISYSPDPIKEHIESVKNEDVIKEIERNIKLLKGIKDNISKSKNGIEVELKKSLINLKSSISAENKSQILVFFEIKTAFANYKSTLYTQFTNFKNFYEQNRITIPDSTQIKLDSSSKFYTINFKEINNNLVETTDFNKIILKGKLKKQISDQFNNLETKIKETEKFEKSLNNDEAKFYELKTDFSNLIDKDINNIESVALEFQKAIETINIQIEDLEMQKKERVVKLIEQQKQTTFSPFANKTNTFYIYLDKNFNDNKTFAVGQNLDFSDFDITKTQQKDLVDYLIRSDYYLRDSLPKQVNGGWKRGAIIGYHGSTIYKKRVRPFEARKYQVKFETLKFLGKDDSDNITKKVNHKRFLERLDYKKALEKFTELHQKYNKLFGFRKDFRQVRQTIKIFKIVCKTTSIKDFGFLNDPLKRDSTEKANAGLLKNYNYRVLKELNKENLSDSTSLKISKLNKLRQLKWKLRLEKQILNAKIGGSLIWSVFRDFKKLSVWDDYNFKIVEPINGDGNLWLEVNKKN